MTTETTPDAADTVISVLRAHEAELREAGIRHLSLFGSVARGHATPEHPGGFAGHQSSAY